MLGGAARTSSTFAFTLAFFFPAAPFAFACGCDCWVFAEAALFWLPVKSGALLAGAEPPPACSSAMLKLIMSTMLDTSFLTFSGRDDGRDLPVSFRLQRYMARANSGKCSWPARVVSERVLHAKNMVSA